jgi:hypothetical protein
LGNRSCFSASNRGADANEEERKVHGGLAGELLWFITKMSVEKSVDRRTSKAWACEGFS